MVIIRQIINNFNSCLNNDFGTFIAREECGIHSTALQINACLVHDGIRLSMDHYIIMCSVDVFSTGIRRVGGGGGGEGG